MIQIRHLSWMLLLTLSSIAYGQKKKPVIHYKTITDKTFSIGDRIDMGEIEVVMLPLGKDSLRIPDSLDIYRKFIQNNRFITFKLHMNWKSQGVKYPGRTDRTRDALLTYFNDDGSEQDSVCDITLFHHNFVKKQVPVLQIEVEVIDVKAPNLQGQRIHGTIGQPEYNLLYRAYDNRITFAVSGAVDRYWLSGNGVAITGSDKRDEYIARVTGTGRTATMTLKWMDGADTISGETYTYRITNLPRPSVYLGTIPLEQLASTNEGDIIGMTRLFAKYPPEIPMIALYEVTVFSVFVGDREIHCGGADLSEEFRDAYKNAEKGTVIRFGYIKAKGLTSFYLENSNCQWIKQTAKGTAYSAS